jgi:hypothetical protein
MTITWNGQADAGVSVLLKPLSFFIRLCRRKYHPNTTLQLFASVLKVHDIKMNYAAVAEAMGGGATPKAIQHRITSIKHKAVDEGEESAITTTPNRTQGKGKGKSGARKRKNGDNDEEEMLAGKNIKVKQGEANGEVMG